MWGQRKRAWHERTEVSLTIKTWLSCTSVSIKLRNWSLFTIWTQYLNKAINSGQPLGGKTYHGWHFPKNDGTSESNFHRPPVYYLADKWLPYVAFDAKHWEQFTFHCQHQVHERGTKHAGKKKQLLSNCKQGAVWDCMKMKYSKKSSTLALFLAPDTIYTKDRKWL